MKKLNGFVKTFSGSFVYVILLTFAFALFVGLEGDFPINDDFYFMQQTRSFSQGIFGINAEIDPSFILQGLVGTVWGRLLGFNFVSFRLLTLVFYLLMCYGVYLILKEFGPKTNRLFFLLMFAVNPLLLTLALTFMTEIYFLTFMVWSIYFYLKFTENEERRFFIIAILLSGLSFLVRQFGLIVSVSMIAVMRSRLWGKYKKRGINYVELVQSKFSVMFIFSIFPIIYASWPRFSDESIFHQQFYLQDLGSKLTSILLGLPLIILILSPLILNFLLVNYKKFKLFYIFPIAIVSFVLAYLVFIYDLFPLGNIFYIEKLYAKSGFRSNLSIFDNVLFKSIVSLRIGLSISILLSLLVIKRSSIKDYFRNIFSGTYLREDFLALNTVGMFLILLFPKDTYDRYFLPFVVSLFIMIVVKIKDIKVHILSYFLIFTLFLLTALLNYQYMTIQRLKYKQAGQLTELTGLIKQIQVDDTYLKYKYSIEINDPTGLKGSKPKHLDYVCYIRDYTLDTESPVLQLFESFDDFLQRFADNPKIYQRKNIPTNRIKNNLDKLVINDEYFSPIYSIIGKRAFVGSWCEPEIIRPKTLSTL